MPCYVANAGHDERGKYLYGTAGDQSGTEFHIIPWYYFYQNAVLRYPYADAREMFAVLATEAANNDRIGYDQSQRMTFFYELEKVGWHPERIRKDVETDCSAATCAIVYAAGKLLDIPELLKVNPAGTTYNMVRTFRNAGFEVLTGNEYLTSGNHLYTGDININESKHTNIVVNGGSAQDSKLIIDGWIGRYSVRELQRQLGTFVDGVIEGQYIGNQRYLERLESVEWQCTGSPCVRKLQSRIGAAVDGIAGYETVSKLQQYLNAQHGETLMVDGVLGNFTACALQRALNDGVFRKK